MMFDRFILYPKDIQLITGRSERYGQDIIAAIKKKRGKEKHQLVTFNDFCEFAGIELHELLAHLRTTDSKQ
jgi:hypothetical protein